MLNIVVGIWFLLYVLLAYLFWIFAPKRKRIYYFEKLYFFIMKYSIKFNIKGLQHLQKITRSQKPVIILCNHLNYLDIHVIKYLTRNIPTFTIVKRTYLNGRC